MPIYIHTHTKAFIKLKNRLWAVGSQPKDAGFTLLELLVAIVIIGTLTSIVIVALGGATDSAKIAKGKTFAQQVHALLGWEIKGQWNFDEGVDNTCSGGEDVCDYSGYGNHGTISRGASGGDWVTSQVEGYAIEFDGVDDYVDAGNPASLTLTGNAVSMTMWIKWTVFGDSIPFGKIQVWAGGYGFMQQNVKRMTWNVVDTSGVVRGAASGALNENQWYFIAGTYNGTNIRLYINGLLVYQNTYTEANIQTTTKTFRLGNYAGFGTWFKGTIDDVRIYAAALPSAAIQKHYVQGLQKLLANNAITEEEYNQRMAKFNSSLVTK